MSTGRWDQPTTRPRPAPEPWAPPEALAFVAQDLGGDSPPNPLRLAWTGAWLAVGATVGYAVTRMLWTLTVYAVGTAMGAS